MAEAATRSPVPGQRVLIACLAVLLGILMANEVCDPIVRTFGLAHAKVVAGEHGRILVLDSLPSADAPSVQTVFQGEIWGRHSYKVHQVLLPFLMLTMAMAGLAHLLARHVSGVGWRFFHLQRGSALPPVSLWVALFMGGCLAAWSVEGPNFHSSFALIPFVLSLSLGAVISVSPQPNASVLARVFAALSASRWFWLGFLALSPQGLFRYEGLAESARPHGWSAPSLLACGLALLALHLATRAPRRMDLKRFSGDTAYLRDEVERLSLLAIQELWMLFPAVLIGAVVNSVRLEHLASYLGASVACALVMRAALQPGPARLFFRLLTVLLLLALPLAGWLRELQPDFQPPLVGWLVACAVALALGRPWLPGAAPAEPVEHPAGEASKVRLNASVLALGLVTVAVLALALRGSLPFPASDPVMARAQSQLAEAFGHQARLLRLNGQALLVGCDLDVGRLSLAAEIVSNHLPDTETRVVSVRTRRWERLGHLFLALTVALFLVFPTYFLTFGAPGPAARPYMGFCALIAGANGAFTVGSALGWFWMNPMPHLAAFLLSASLGWLGLGHARAWVDQQITGLTGAAGAGSSPQRPWPAPGRPTLYDTP